jgi:hypothetical protein
MEAICSRCRKKTLAEHHCKDWVEKEQPKHLLKCTCPCNGKTDIEERKKSNDEMNKLAYERSRNWRQSQRH